MSSSQFSDSDSRNIYTCCDTCGEAIKITIRDGKEVNQTGHAKDCSKSSK